MTQIEMVAKHLKEKGTITTWEAIKEYGCTRLSDKIYKLKKDGYVITTIRKQFVNRYGQKGSFAEYKLERCNYEICS